MVRLRLALVCSFGVLLYAPQAAAGGGWWSSIIVPRTPVAPEQRVELAATVSYKSAAAAKAAQQTRFYVYLLRGFDDAIVERVMRRRAPGDWWSLGGAEAIEVAHVTLKVSDANLGRATAAFTLPEVSPGTYHLMLCDAACIQPLADVIPTAGFTVVADPVTARTAERVARLERRSRRQSGELVAARADTDKARAELKQLEARVSPPADEVQSSAPARRWAYGAWGIAGALAAALSLLVFRHRRSQPPQPAHVVGWGPSDDALRELVTSEPKSPAATGSRQ